MKETRELRTASDVRDAARAAFKARAMVMRGRLAPSLLAAEVAERLAARAGKALFRGGLTRRHTIGVAAGGAVALASAIALRASHRLRRKKTDEAPVE